MTFSPEEIDLDQLVGEVRDILRPLMNSKHIHFGTEIDTALTGVVIDPAKLKQVLYNYLSNALKFTPDEGQVTVRIKPEGEDAFLLEVEDTGIGIPSEDLGRLFVEFQQLDAGMAKKHQGTCQGQVFDVITLDLLLPDASGWDVLRRIRAGGPNRDVPIIV